MYLIPPLILYCVLCDYMYVPNFCVQFKFSGCYVPVYGVCLNPVLTSLGTSKCVVLGMIFILVGAYGPELVMQFTCLVPLK